MNSISANFDDCGGYITHRSQATLSRREWDRLKRNDGVYVPPSRQISASGGRSFAEDSVSESESEDEDLFYGDGSAHNTDAPDVDALEMLRQYKEEQKGQQDLDLRPDLPVAPVSAIATEPELNTSPKSAGKFLLDILSGGTDEDTAPEPEPEPEPAVVDWMASRQRTSSRHNFESQETVRPMTMLEKLERKSEQEKAGVSEQHRRDADMPPAWAEKPISGVQLDATNSADVMPDPPTGADALSMLRDFKRKQREEQEQTEQLARAQQEQLAWTQQQQQQQQRLQLQLQQQ